MSTLRKPESKTGCWVARCRRSAIEQHRTCKAHARLEGATTALVVRLARGRIVSLVKRQPGEHMAKNGNGKAAKLANQTFESLGKEIGALVDKKNAAYGKSFDKAQDFLRLLYPNGVAVSQYTDLLTLVRIFDKCMRIATDKDAFGESPWSDLVGYSLLGLRAHAISSKA